MSKLTGAEIIWESLTKLGADVVFGYPGGAILPAYDAMIRYPIRHILVRHEQGAAHMADGYARASGRVGLCMATSGPGAANLVCGLATAYLDSIPVVAITGQVASRLIGSDAFQEIDVTGVTLPVTKHNYLVTRAAEITPALKEAWHIARTGRPGPVLVDIAKDAQQEAIAWEWDPAPVSLPGYRATVEALQDEYERAVELIASSSRPLILAGHGVLQAHAESILKTFVDRTSMPVALTLLGIGALPASHRCNLGMMGMHGEAWVNMAIQRADLLIAIGMRFDDRVTGNLRTYAQNARKIHIEIDPSEINKNVLVDVDICGDAADVLERLIPRVEARGLERWHAEIDEYKREAAERDIQRQPEDGRYYAAHAIRDLWEQTRSGCTIVTDVGQHQMWAAQYYHHDDPRRFITSGGLGTMGFGLPAAVGAKVARPDDEVWLIAGDGGFQMTAAELSTCRQEGIKVNVLIVNNGYLGMVRQWQEFFYDRRYVATPLVNPDFVKLAEAHGLAGRRVEKRGDLPGAIEAARATEGTFVIECVVEREDAVFPMVPAGADLHQMIRRPVAQCVGR